MVTFSETRIDGALCDWAGRSPQRVVLVDGGATLTFGELAGRAASFARLLRERRLQPGDRATIYLDKTPDAIAAMYGVWRSTRAGTVVVGVGGASGQRVALAIRPELSNGATPISTWRHCHGIQPPAAHLASSQRISVATEQRAPVSRRLHSSLRATC